MLSCIIEDKNQIEKSPLNKSRRKIVRNIKTYISIAIGILFCGSVLIGYTPIPKYVIELTCISNLFIGILLFFTGVNMLTKKKKFRALFIVCGS